MGMIIIKFFWDSEAYYMWSLCQLQFKSGLEKTENISNNKVQPDIKNLPL